MQLRVPVLSRPVLWGGLAHAGGVAIAIAWLGPHGVLPRDILPNAVVLASIGAAIGRVATISKQAGWLAFGGDAVVAALLLTSLGPPGMPLFAYALAGTWWAAHVRPSHGGLTYALILAAAATVFMAAGANVGWQLAELLERGLILLAVGLLVDVASRPGAPAPGPVAADGARESIPALLPTAGMGGLAASVTPTLLPTSSPKDAAILANIEAGRSIVEVAWITGLPVPVVRERLAANKAALETGRAQALAGRMPIRTEPETRIGALTIVQNHSEPGPMSTASRRSMIRIGRS